MRRYSIARLMAVIATLGFNIGLVRAILVADSLAGALPIAFILQFAAWRYLCKRGRFWLGFFIGGVASVLGLFACEMFPDSVPGHLLGRYLMFAFNLAQRHLPTVLDDLIMDHRDWFLVIAYFLPELAASILGGLIALGLRRSAVTVAPKEAPCAASPSVP